MISKNKLKELAAYRLQKRCDEEAVFVVEGPKMASEVLASGFTVRVVCATGEWWEGERLKVKGEMVGERYEVSELELERLSNFKTPNQVWMLVERDTKDLKDLKDSKDPKALTLALDHIQDPGNLGTMLRTADWFGIRHVVCSRDTVSCYNPKVVQASMGAIFRTRVIYCDLAETITQYAAEGYTAYGAMLDGDDAFASPKVKPSLLVIGNEGHGISEEVSAVVGHRLTIPNIGGTCESLNAAVATAILMSEFYR